MLLSSEPFAGKLLALAPDGCRRLREWANLSPTSGPSLKRDQGLAPQLPSQLVLLRGGEHRGFGEERVLPRLGWCGRRGKSH